jgi:hypothetical protein
MNSNYPISSIASSLSCIRQPKAAESAALSDCWKACVHFHSDWRGGEEQQKILTKSHELSRQKVLNLVILLFFFFDIC